jgi:hypothetical protein
VGGGEGKRKEGKKREGRKEKGKKITAFQTQGLSQYMKILLSSKFLS